MGKREKAEARAKRRKSRLIKKVVIWVVVLVGTGALIFFLAAASDENGNDGGSRSAIPEVNARDWVKWNPDSPVQLVEYSDFQCPACASFFPLLNAVGQEYGDRIAFVYRHYPLAQIHFNANAAAKAAEAAGKQGKFWEMHDQLFQTQELWSGMSASDAASVFGGFAKNFDGIDLDQYLADFDSDESQNAVTADFSGGVSSGVNSTPTFYLNGERIRNPSNIEEFRALLDKALANAEANTQ